MMKNLQRWAIALLSFVVLVNCRKPRAPFKEPNESLEGKWNYTAHYFSIGSPGDWHPVIAGQWIELRGNGGFSSNIDPYSSAIGYRVMDSMRLTLIRQPGRDSLLYFYSLRGDTLDLVPFPFCIEGCKDRFLKQ
jgi:hypothetical protein